MSGRPSSAAGLLLILAALPASARAQGAVPPAAGPASAPAPAAPAPAAPSGAAPTTMLPAAPAPPQSQAAQAAATSPEAAAPVASPAGASSPNTTPPPANSTRGAPPLAAATPPAPVAAPPLGPQPEDETQLLVRWGARVMPGYELRRSHESSAQGGDDAEQYGVFLDQARIELEAERGMLELEISVELADAIHPKSVGAQEQPPYVRDAYLGARFSKALRLRAGHFKRPFSRLELTSSGVLPVRGRGLANSLIVEAARFGDRGLGLMLWGKTKGKLAYYVELSNPKWASDIDLGSDGVLCSARVEWSPIDRLSLGADYGYEHSVLDGPDDHAHGFGFDAKLQSGPLQLLLDAHAARLPSDLRPGSYPSPPFAIGLVSYGTYDVPLQEGLVLQPALLVELADQSLDFSRDEALRGVLGLNLVLRDGLRVMPQVEVVRSLKAASADSPFTNSERYYLLLSAQL